MGALDRDLREIILCDAIIMILIMFKNKAMIFYDVNIDDKTPPIGQSEIHLVFIVMPGIHT